MLLVLTLQMTFGLQSGTFYKQGHLRKGLKLDLYKYYIFRFYRRGRQVFTVHVYVAFLSAMLAWTRPVLSVSLQMRALASRRKGSHEE